MALSIKIIAHSPGAVNTSKIARSLRRACYSAI
jgi:hypothetical protein